MCENAAALATASQIGRRGWRAAALDGGRATRLFLSPPCPPRSKTQGCRKLEKCLLLHFLLQTFFCWISISSSIGFLMCAFSAMRLFFPSVLLSLESQGQRPRTLDPARGPPLLPSWWSLVTKPHLKFQFLSGKK